MEKNAGIFDECYKCHETFDIYKMYVYNRKNICVPCYEKLGFYYEVDVENKTKEKFNYIHIPRHILDYMYAALDPDKWY
jgi:recombinational DNA repair protein (RecF pathway)